MQGYSVPEAASVLGVAEGKVWELLARGVLSGTTEGESMRVYLKAEASPAVSHPDRTEPHRPNGNGGNGGAEASPFRELLTEFRNLTERYGQALLALGEARGEVAGLRSRVEGLEARLDLRLPGPGFVPPVAWERPEPAPEPEAVEAEPEEVAAALAEPMASSGRAAPRQSRPRKAPSARAAVAGFAEALARAQDPSTARVPGVGEAAAESEPLVEAEAASDEVEAVALPELPDAAPVVVEPLPTKADAEAATDADAALFEQPAAAELEGPAAIEAEAEAEAAAAAVEPTPSYTTDTVEPDWFADGDFAWLEAAEMEAQGASEIATLHEAPEPPMSEEADAARAREAQAWGGGTSLAEAAEEMEVAPAARTEPSSPSDDELARLAREEGWDAAEVEAIRALVGQGEASAIALPGADELDAALAALDAPVAAPEATALEETEAPESEVAEPEPPLEAEAEPPQSDWPSQEIEAHEWAKAQIEEAFDEPAMPDAAAEPAQPELPEQPEEPEAYAEPASAEPGPYTAPTSPEAYAYPEPEPAYPEPGPYAAPDEQAADEHVAEIYPFEPTPPVGTPPVARPQIARSGQPDPAWLRRRRGPAANAYRRLRRLFG